MLSPLLYLCVLVIISTVFGDTSVKITQFPEYLTANRGTNITFYCGYPFSLHSSRIQVYWRKQGETTYLHTQEDSRKRFGVKSKGNRFFQFLDVNIQDAAVYHCELVLEGKKVGNGNGSRLIVYVPPTPLAISRMDPERNLSVFLTLVCETAEFFPENLNLTWYKNGIEITTVNTITEQRNPGQLFKAHSYLEETQPVQSGDVYTCLVSHVSLQNPGIANYTVLLPHTGIGDWTNNLFAPGCAGGACALLLIFILFAIGCRLKKRKGSGVIPNETDCPGKRTAMEADAERMVYATLDLTGSKKVGKPKHQEERTVYAQTKQGTSSNKVTYAALDLSGSKKTATLNHNDKNTEYAEIQMKKLQRSNRDCL
uniref:Tyrosine-protein phosphatase non-receptor type substrate 1-like n=1 Tax=Callorhinchus milii TaxID=7868 RepID=A0A4W3H5P9_CALMI|eukprot:gi/632972775/ref/XP_007902825.1/ PREDICTED: tyrosine-protein phosphatase non-receptor type substrate 1-like [Callorhinchus milii]